MHLLYLPLKAHSFVNRALSLDGLKRFKGLGPLFTQPACLQICCWRFCPKQESILLRMVQRKDATIVWPVKYSHCTYIYLNLEGQQREEFD